MADPYQLAQRAIADLKSAVLQVVTSAGEAGIKNADIGRALGIHEGHQTANVHEGHLTLTLLKRLSEEGLVEQIDDRTKAWRRPLAKNPV